MGMYMYCYSPGSGWSPLLLPCCEGQCIPSWQYPGTSPNLITVDEFNTPQLSHFDRLNSNVFSWTFLHVTFYIIKFVHIHTLYCTWIALHINVEQLLFDYSYTYCTLLHFSFLSLTLNSTGCQMKTAKNVMNVEKNLIHFVGVITVDFVDRYSVIGVVILKFLEKLWVTQVGEFFCCIENIFNSPFAQWHHFTTTTRMLHKFYF